MSGPSGPDLYQLVAQILEHHDGRTQTGIPSHETSPRTTESTSSLGNLHHPGNTLTFQPARLPSGVRLVHAKRLASGQGSSTQAAPGRALLPNQHHCHSCLRRPQCQYTWKAQAAIRVALMATEGIAYASIRLTLNPAAHSGRGHLQGFGNR